MIFVTVGNANQGFRRLLEAVDDLAGTGILNGEDVFMQIGHNPDFRPKHCAFEPFLPMERFETLLRKCDLIISHGGCTLLSAFRVGKMPVAMPRRRKYGEHVDDHQVQFVQALSADGLVVPAYEPEELAGAIVEARRRARQPCPPPRSRMPELVGQAIRELIGQATDGRKE